MSPRWPDQAVGETAARQATMISREQLLGLGIAPATIAEAVARCRLYREHTGVYSLVPARARPILAAEWAGLLACGPRAVLSHHSAARLHELEVPRSKVVELIVVDGDRARGRPRLLVHRQRILHQQELSRVRTLPVTSIARTVLDLSAELPSPSLERLVDDALKRVRRAELQAVLKRHAGARGTRALRMALDPERPTEDAWSKAEAHLLVLLRRGGVPTPETNVMLGRYRPDMLWRDGMVIVEFDSWLHHSGPAAFRGDRARHNDLVAQGYQVIHVTWDALVRTPEKVLVWITAALVRSGIL